MFAVSFRIRNMLWTCQPYFNSLSLQFSRTGIGTVISSHFGLQRNVENLNNNVVFLIMHIGVLMKL